MPRVAKRFVDLAYGDISCCVLTVGSLPEVIRYDPAHGPMWDIPQKLKGAMI